MNEIIWILPILFIVHDMEEIIGFGLWLKRNRIFLSEKYPLIQKTYTPYSTEGMARFFYYFYHSFADSYWTEYYN